MVFIWCRREKIIKEEGRKEEDRQDVLVYLLLYFLLLLLFSVSLLHQTKTVSKEPVFFNCSLCVVV